MLFEQGWPILLEKLVSPFKQLNKMAGSLKWAPNPAAAEHRAVCNNKLLGTGELGVICPKHSW